MKRIFFFIIIFFNHTNIYQIFTLPNPFLDPGFSRKVTLIYNMKEKEKTINNALKITIISNYEDLKYKVIFHYAPGVHKYFFEHEGIIEYFFNKKKIQPINAFFYDKNWNKLGETIYDFSENKYIVTNYARNIYKKNINFNNYPVDNWTFFILPSGLPLEKLIKKEIKSVECTSLYGDLSTNKMSVEYVFIGEKRLFIKTETFSTYELYYKFKSIFAIPYSINIWIQKETPHYILKFEVKKNERVFELNNIEYQN